MLVSNTSKKLSRIVELIEFDERIDFAAIKARLSQMNSFALTYIRSANKKIRGYILIVYNEKRISQQKFEELATVLSDYISENKLNFIYPRYYKKREMPTLSLMDIY